MDNFDQQVVLDSLTVLCDSREQDTERAERRYKAFGVPHRKAILDYGDYTYQATLPDGSLIFNEAERIFPRIAIERKMSLDKDDPSLRECEHGKPLLWEISEQDESESLCGFRVRVDGPVRYAAYFLQGRNVGKSH